MSRKLMQRMDETNALHKEEGERSVADCQTESCDKCKMQTLLPLSSVIVRHRSARYELDSGRDEGAHSCNNAQSMVLIPFLDRSICLWAGLQREKGCTVLW